MLSVICPTIQGPYSVAKVAKSYRKKIGCDASLDTTKKEIPAGEVLLIMNLKMTNERWFPFTFDKFKVELCLLNVDINTFKHKAECLSVCVERFTLRGRFYEIE